MQVVGTIVQGQLVVLAVQRELTFADAVAPTANQGGEERFLPTHQLFNVGMALNNVTYFAVLVRYHDGHNGSSIV